MHCCLDLRHSRRLNHAPDIFQLNYNAALVSCSQTCLSTPSSRRHLRGSCYRKSPSSLSPGRTPSGVKLRRDVVV
ncbi:hypothetical protein VZT92_006194 [Zoarces viviparus]|uniref:Uncharacterized protein n=1 Tax=Zoarces viviparus TaxID=48416 RepID=A0AAW1FQG5_ZOAVI